MPVSAEEPHALWDTSPQWPTLPAALADAAATVPDAVGVIDGDHRLTYADYADQSLTVARALVAAGVGKGDRVAIWLQNRWEWPVICLGIWRTGAIAVPINTRLKGIEAADILERTRAKVLLALPSLLGIDYLRLLHQESGAPTDDRPFEHLPHLELAVHLGDGPGTEGCVPYADFLATADAVDPATVADREASLQPDDPAELLFTSGTTGRPKGVVLGHQQLLRSYWDWSGIVGLHEHDRFLLTSPYAHGPGINGNLVASLMRRFASVAVDVFDAPTVLDLVLREGVTAMLGPANLYARLMAAAEAAAVEAGADGLPETPQLRLAILGMAAIPPELIARLRDEWSVELICNAYGAIESTVVSMTRPDDPPELVERATGRALPDVELRVVDDEGNDVPAGQPGELLVRSFAVMQRYWDAPEATADAVTPDGWFLSGDIVTRDPDGNVTIVDRKKEVFMVNGFSVYPAEVESLLLRHPALAHSAVVAVPDDGSGESGVAYVVPRSGATVDTAELATWARDAMASYKVPRHFVVLDELPVAATGKTDRKGLRERWLVDAARTTA